MLIKNKQCFIGLDDKELTQMVIEIKALSYSSDWLINGSWIPCGYILCLIVAFVAWIVYKG